MLMALVSKPFAQTGGGMASTPTQAARPDKPAQVRLLAKYGELPLSFEANAGQVNSVVKFLSRGQGYTLYLTGDEAVLKLQESKVRSQEPGVRTKDFGRLGALRGTKQDGPRTADVLRMKLVGANSGAVEAWLRFLIQSGRVDDAQRTWEWAVERGYADDAAAGAYAQFLIEQSLSDLAASAWMRYLGTRSGEHRRSTYLFNGDFESEPTRSPFDWNLARTQGVDAARDCTTAGAGKCSLRIGLAGTQNLEFAVASQVTFLTPGVYRFHALIRTEGLTTDQGIRFRIFDPDSTARLDVTFENFTGSKAWSSVGHDLVVPPPTRLLQVQVIRQRSMRFDNKIGGTAWIDELSLEPISFFRPPKPYLAK
jgi:hypothetical protein